MKIPKLRIFFATAMSALFVAALYQAAEACSRVLWRTRDNGVFVARSMDWSEVFDPKLMIYPRGTEVSGGTDRPAKWSSQFGSLVVVGVNYDNAAVDGMNEKGLTAHLLYLEATSYEKRDARPGVSYLNWLRYMLDNNATVTGALDALKGVQVVPVPVHGKIFGLHMAIEDPTGDSAIIEFIKGKMVIHHGPQYAVMTNDPPYDIAIRKLRKYQSFGGTKPLPGNIGSFDRFVRAEYFLKYLPQPSDYKEGLAFIFQVIRNVSVPFGAPYGSNAGETYPTWWVTAADLTNRTYFFNMTSSPNVVWIELDKLNFAKSQPVEALDLKDIALVGDVARDFKPASGK